jgi:Glycosyl hydrolase family 9/Cellulase N-terminal ig-like domain
MVGYYLGSLGEMIVPPPADSSLLGFKLIDAASGAEVFSGPLRLRPDEGFTFPTYQRVWQADFTEFRRPGRYRLLVPGLGASFPFWIDEGVAAAFARTYALGLYHQRCGTANALPFTRFTHGPCHAVPAEVPTMAFKASQQLIKGMSDGAKQDPRHTAPRLQSVATSLYPFVQQGKVDVRGGHHDAGDYSKYTINSAALIHYLVFAADVFPGVADLDNLGIPESGDGKSDLLREAKWEADFLAKMQDDDGGFYFLVYPKERAYEDDVLPDHGDPQVVWPKTSAVTAAAVAALAQASSSPRFRQQFPEAATLYWEKAQKGWAFLQRAIPKYGWYGSYQKISHYGNEFLHDDEMAWAATEMFVATGDHAYENQVISRFDPSDRNTRRWTWWRLFEAYGCSVRDYAFAVKSGRLKQEQLNPLFLAKCRREILAAGQDQARFARECAYGSSFPDPNKRFRNAGWYFSNDQAFDLAVAAQLDIAPAMPDPRPAFLEAMISNMNYEGGCNPVNVTYLTGLGWKRQHEIVHQYALNDRRSLPPSGLPIGNIQAGFQHLDTYKRELGTLSYPPDGAPNAPYPFYDRWGDSFNTTTEFVIVNQGRALAELTWLMAQTPLKNQPWRCSSTVRITGLPTQAVVGQPFTARVQDPELDLAKAQIVWEGRDQEPAFGQAFTVTPKSAGACWLEVEAQGVDGRRAFAAADVTVRPR